MPAPKFLLGRKVGMTQIHRGDEGDVVPVTVIATGPCVVSQVKTVETDGYLALQLAFEECREKVKTKPLNGHFKKHGVKTHRFLREVRLKEPTDLKVGDTIKCDVFTAGEKVDVIGTVKGRGFQGVMRVWNFGHKPEAHGNMNQRGPGSIGMHTRPGEVLKGHKMATHWGDERCTMRNLEVVDVDLEKNAMLVYGTVPGNRGDFVMVRAAKASRPKKTS